MATTGILSAHPLLLLLRELEHRGIDPSPALQSSGLTLDRLHRLDVPVPAVQGLRLVRHLIDLTGDPDLGLAAGRLARPEDLGLPGLALRSSRDVTTGLALFSQIQLSSAPYFSGGIGFSPDGLAVHYDPELGRRTPRALHDLFLTSAYSIARNVLDDFLPAALELALPEPADRSGYDRLLPVPARFGRQRTRIVIPAAVLQGVLPHHDELVHRMIASHVLDQQPGSPPADLVSEVRALLLASPDSGLPSITEVAQRLATSARHLRRQLQAEGTSYLELLDEAKRELVLQYLAEHPRATGPELAARLGYTEPPAFYRAFKRWTGLTVTEYRERLRSTVRAPRTAPPGDLDASTDDLSGVSPSPGMRTLV